MAVFLFCNTILWGYMRTTSLMNNTMSITKAVIVYSVVNGITGRIMHMTHEVLIVFSMGKFEIRRICVLYGLPNKTWEVNLLVEEVPPELPEPALGINFARDRMQEKDWLSLVAVYSDSWLLFVAFYFGARFGFGKSESYNQSVSPVIAQINVGYDPTWL
ncbi:PHD finger protein ALFIN-LIKE 6-like [Camellia sinensis]|uniref:PHD finger protein ALFIN-LIKE 6-like n=1 Tax=Camellia sinensis TaxID=4442 RepID=UPI001035AD4F|nr:PHD finger protein ALFIN-LIKE 6-like [Camellia sinensis]